MEPLPLRQLADRPGARASGADDRNAGEMCSHRFEIDGAVQRQQARFIELDARFEITTRGAGHDDASVDELLAVHTRDHADHRVVIRAVILHGSPPR